MSYLEFEDTVFEAFDYCWIQANNNDTFAIAVCTKTNEILAVWTRKLGVVWEHNGVSIVWGD